MNNKRVLVLIIVIAAFAVGMMIREKNRSSANGHADCQEAGHACGSDTDYGGDHKEEDAYAAHDDCAESCSEGLSENLEKVTCEHHIPIIDCDSCRYEVGVVKITHSVANTLIQTGLVEDIERKTVLKFTGQVQLDRTRTVDVVPTASGRVERVSKLLGEKVKKGDVLAVIHSADLGQVKADFLEVQANLDLTQATFKREKELFEEQITSQADYQKALNELKAAQASYAAADRRLRLFGLGTEQIAGIKNEKENGEFASLTLRAPQAGTIIAQNISVGKMVETRENLFVITDLSNLWVWCDIYGKDLAALHQPFEKGQSLNAVVQVNAFAESAFEGVVDLVGNLMDERTRTVKIRVQVKNPENKLRPGMFAEVSVMVPGEGHITAVPRNAIMSDEGNCFVFSHLKDDLWIRRDVIPGQSQGRFVEILKGVSKADRIITGGAFMFKSEVLKEKMGAGCAH
ncbi:MAG: efflux RND transporter periplasmic adaptor subunit [Phycisphaerae bacterium]|nr:efflux RND transporter periplasmic adaptor subunit [Phycisphaerae bacterium]